MKAVILGSGNVAEALAEAIAAKPAAELELVQLYGRGASGADLARRLGIPATDSTAALAPADIYIMAVSDDAISSLSELMVVPGDAVVAHTAGGVGIDAISGRIANRAVFYPLQTFSRGRRIDFAAVPVFIEYNNAHAEETVRRFAEIVAGNVMEADSSLRARLHVAAVFACNFTNHLYALGDGLLKEDKLSFDLLAPLIRETAEKAIASGDPTAVQTGPAARGDRDTIRRHLEMLAADGKIDCEKIYKLLSQSIWETSRKT